MKIQDEINRVKTELDCLGRTLEGRDYRQRALLRRAMDQLKDECGCLSKTEVRSLTNSIKIALEEDAHANTAD